MPQGLAAGQPLHVPHPEDDSVLLEVAVPAGALSFTPRQVLSPGGRGSPYRWRSVPSTGHGKAPLRLANWAGPSRGIGVMASSRSEVMTFSRRSASSWS